MKSVVISLTVCMFLLPAINAFADVPQMINYQGELTNSSGAPLDTTVSITFTIYDDSTGGTAKWTEVHPTVTVNSGLFSAILGEILPIDDSVFINADRWLGIQVGADPEISPRTQFITVPYAYRVSTVDGAAGGIIYGDVSIQSDLDVAGTVQMLGFEMPTGATDSYVLTSNASGAGTWQPVSGTADNDWTYQVTDTDDTTLMMGGQWGIAGPGNTLYGNLDRTHVNFGVSCTTGTDGYNYPYCAVGGGLGNNAGGEYATISGGVRNTAGGFRAVVGGGGFNTASHQYATVAGGDANTAGQIRTTVSGGYQNSAVTYGATIGGGSENRASGYFSTICGGYYDTASGENASIGGGMHNVASGYSATVPGGRGNRAEANGSFACGRDVTITSDATFTFAYGRDFTTSTPYAAIFHNSLNPISVGIGTTSPTEMLDVAGTAQVTGFKMPTGAADSYVLTSDGSGAGTWQPVSGTTDNDWTYQVTDTDDTTLMMGGQWGIARAGNVLYGIYDNTHTNFGVSCTTGTEGYNNTYCAVGGGLGNAASGSRSTISGGRENVASNEYTTIGGGYLNTASGNRATVAGGIGNVASGDYSIVAGGSENASSGMWSTVGGGETDTASGDWATIGGGIRNYATADYTTVAGGDYNQAGANYASIGGGVSHEATGTYATVPGGYNNTAAGYASMAAGDHVVVDAAADWTFAFGRNFTTSTPYAVIFHDATGLTKVGIGTPNPQGALDVNSTTGAFIVPRMTQAQRDSFTPVDGMIIYNTDTNRFNFRENGGWKNRNDP